MKYLLTGMHGTVAPAIADYLRSRGDEAIAYDRQSHDVNNQAAVSGYLNMINPDAIIHAALGSSDWARMLALYAANNGKKFAYISTVDVFGEHNPGPYTVATEPKPETQYGYYKLDVERAIAFTSPEAFVFRLGWMIGDRPGSNNMIDFLDRVNRESGGVDADDTWRPSCAYLKDTAEQMVITLEAKRPDLYLFNGNKDRSFYDIVSSISASHPELNLNVRRVSAMNRDNIMVDPRVLLQEVV